MHVYLHARSFVELPDLESTLLALDFAHLDWRTAAPASATFLLVSLFDCSGCLIGLSMKVPRGRGEAACRQAGRQEGARTKPHAHT